MTQPWITLSGIKIPYDNSWFYRVYRDYDTIDSFTSKVKLSAQDMIDVQNYYAESLDGYLLGGTQLPPQETFTPWTKPVFQNRRRTIRAVED